MQTKLLEFLGGESLQEKCPVVYEALSKATVYHKDMLSTCSEPGVLDVYLKTEEVFADEAGVGILQRNGFLKSAAFVAMVSELYDEKTGRLIDTFNEYWEASTYNEVKNHSSTMLAKQAAKNDLRLVTTYTWSKDGQTANEYTEEFSVAQFTENEPIITELSVTAPRAKDKKMTSVLYDRERFVTTKTDYHYTNVVLPGAKRTKVKMPFTGSLSVASGFKITGIQTGLEPPEMCLILEHGGTVNYNYSAKEFENQLTISDEGGKMTWEFNVDWKSELDLTHFTAKTVVDFSCTFTLEVEKKDAPGIKFHPKIMISSAKAPELRGAGAIEIEPINISWGCLAKGTKIRMADGSEMAIENIRPLDIVRTADGQAITVIDIVSGTEEQLVFLETHNGYNLSLTETHPVKTARGIVTADEVTAADIICTADGESQVKSIYMDDYNDKVYNIVLEHSSTIYCNGIIAGDFDMQNNPMVENAAPVERTPLQVELCELMKQSR